MYSLLMFKILWILPFLQDATDGRGADVIVEMLANASLTKDLQLVALKGRIGVCLTCRLIFEV